MATSGMKHGLRVLEPPVVRDGVTYTYCVYDLDTGRALWFLNAAPTYGELRNKRNWVEA